MTTYHEGFSSAMVEPPDYEPVATSFFGLRCFLIDDGKLRGTGIDTGNPYGVPPNGGQVHFPRKGALRSIFRERYVWGPGINVAECLRMIPWGGKHRLPAHTTVQQECDCGFWAYTHGKHVLQVNGHAAFGVIEAGGKMAIGPHGFRSQHARIVGLCYNTATDDQPGGVLYQLARKAFLAAGPLAAQITTRAPLTVGPAAVYKVAPELADLSASYYPNIPRYDSLAELLHAWPLSDLTSLLPPEEAEEQEAS